jgi:hypothetical protein
MSTGSTPAHAGSPVSAYLRGLVDDAAVFPPGDLPLGRAVPSHRRHRQAPYADLVGPFLVGDGRLGELADLTEPDAEPLALAVVVTGGAGAIAPAVEWAGRAGTLAGIEVALRGSDTGELPHNARRIVTAVDELLASASLDPEVPVSVEMPRLYGGEPGHGWLAALDEVAAMEHRVKFRTGGLDPDAFPSALELATVIDAALDRELPFKCTAGLHHALRHRDDEAFDRPVDRHGFLNVLLATRDLFDGAGPGAAAETLELTDREAVLGRLREVGDDGLASARRWFTSFGSCSVLEPAVDLVALGLVPEHLLADVDEETV